MRGHMKGDRMVVEMTEAEARALASQSPNDVLLRGRAFADMRTLCVSKLEQLDAERHATKRQFCTDCGKPGERVGHQDCQYPGLATGY